MYSVYILLSKKDQRLYVGCTSDLGQRLLRHDKGFVEATRWRRPLVLIYEEKFLDKAKAFNRERFFKSLWSARMKRKIKAEYLQKQITE